ncbi:RecQ family ATP-dependent DNA helicase [Pseudomonas luteola]
MSLLLNNPKTILQEVFGYSEFRGDQEQIVDAVVRGDDVLALMTTGGGKSLCFQVPALCLPGTTIVISPLISLMKDQVDTLVRKGVSAGMINSDMGSDEISNTMFKLANGFYKLMYVAPERLATPDFMDILANIDIPFVAIDEAHCVSMWGHEFRLEYTKIDERLKALGELRGERIPRAALTATATPLIKEDILKQLGMVEAVEFVGSFDRKNLELNVIQSANKNLDLSNILKSHKGEPTMIYCSTAKSVMELYGQLASAGYKVGAYHAKLDKEVKTKMQDDFLNDDIDIMIATNAFGMGVDKPNIRVVVHYQMPGTIEAYGQEAGRAGRDGLDSKCYMLYSKSDRRLHEFFQKMNFPSTEQVESIRAVLSTLADFAEPTAYDAEWLCAMSNAPSLEPFQISGIMKILANQGLIELYEEIDGKAAYVPVDLSKPIDMTHSEERYTLAKEALLNMEHFCNTNLCRKRNFLRYFGEKATKHNCGSCDVCLGLNLKKEQMASIVRPEVVKGIIGLVKHMGQSCVNASLRDVLIGTRNTVTASFEGHPSFGLLSNCTIPEALSTISALHKDGLIVFGHDRLGTVSVSARGQSMLENKEKLQVASRANHNEGKPSGIDEQLKQALIEFRDRWSSELRSPAFMVMGDKLLDKIASEKPRNLEDLSKMGLSAVKVERFGRNLLQIVNKRQVKQDLEISF